MRCLQDTARVVLALWLALAPVKAWAGSMMLLGAGGGSSAPIVFSFSWVSNATDNSNTTPVTYSSMNAGAVDANRILSAFICSRQNTTNTIISATIGGVAATLVNSGATTVAQAVTPSQTNCAIYQAAVPTGTTASVVVTYSNASIRSVVSLYRIVTGTPTATNSGAYVNTSTGGNTVSTTVPVGGGGFVGFAEQASTSAVTWGNAVGDFTANDPGNSSRYSSATITGTGAVSVTTTAGGSNGSMGSWASWGP